MNKKVYVGIYAVSLGLALFFGLVAVVLAVIAENAPGARREIQNIMAPVVVITGIFGVIFLIVYTVYYLLLLAKMWSAIQDGYARTTPGKAVGFLFIPFFNIYWLFNVWGGFPTDYNNYIQRYGLPLPPLSSTLYILFPICVILTSVTFGVSFIVNIIVLLFLTAKTCDVVNGLEAAKPQQQFHQQPYNYAQMPPQNYMR